ncbi:hypothetical protein VST7929_00689 [Vibrio stylophorae]|uniref:Lipoprotein n=1 Tax=Vibrio stylophorae TaxID=659351 RepID=A0ABN8DTY6_9VIBR|nr:hypothetical protein [Vibrio stylophorae]CAH0532842.1 hypothetical protein VST7929_00689 [Vibrio stylophorae]
MNKLVLIALSALALTGCGGDEDKKDPCTSVTDNGVEYPILWQRPDSNSATKIGYYYYQKTADKRAIHFRCGVAYSIQTEAISGKPKRTDDFVEFNCFGGNCTNTTQTSPSPTRIIFDYDGPSFTPTEQYQWFFGEHSLMPTTPLWRYPAANDIKQYLASKNKIAEIWWEPVNKGGGEFCALKRKEKKYTGGVTVQYYKAAPTDKCMAEPDGELIIAPTVAKEKQADEARGLHLIGITSAINVIELNSEY